MTSPASAATVEAFFTRPAELVAPDLLGSSISHGPVVIALTEVEAYLGTADPASHAYRGPTPRNEVMFGPPGRVYVYFIYGMYWAVNLVCGPDGAASAVLLRAGRVTLGEDEARTRRGDVPHHQLARGPGNLAAALGVTGALTGTDLWSGPLRWTPRAGDVLAHATGPRVGVTAGADTPWRRWLPGDPTVSAYRRSKRA